MLSLKNKLAYVLGGNGLIGRSVIKKLENQGCKIINLDLKKIKKSQHTFLKFDCTNIKSIKNYSNIVKKHGLPDIFINCAYPKTKDWDRNNFKDAKLKSLKDNIDYQLSLPSYLIRNVAEINRKKKKRCSIVLVSSIYGVVGQDTSIYKGTKTKENLAYSIIKGAIISLTKQMCAHYSKSGIRINCVSPGGIIDKTKIRSKIYNKLLNNYSKRCPIGRMANPEEIADPIVFLASDSATYISGTNLIVDVGWTSI